MITKRRFSRFLAAAGVVLAMSLPVAAGAQPYPGEVAPQVLGQTLTREAPGCPEGSAGSRNSQAPTPTECLPAQVLGETVSRGGQTLPVTGGDVLGLTALALGAITAGTVLVRRSRTRTT